MEILIDFLKQSTALDLLVVGLILLFAVILVPVGIWIVIASQSRKPIYYFLMIAMVPLLLGLVGTFLRYKSIERAVAQFPEVSPSVVAASRQEAWIVTYLGAAGTALPGLIGAAGLILKKDRKA